MNISATAERVTLTLGQSFFQSCCEVNHDQASFQRFPQHLCLFFKISVRANSESRLTSTRTVYAGQRRGEGEEPFSKKSPLFEEFDRTCGGHALRGVGLRNCCLNSSQALEAFRHLRLSIA
jgi:hypothetical protein